MGEWLEAVRRRAARVVVADMQLSRAPDFWRSLSRVLDIPAPTGSFDFTEDVRAFESCYQDGQGARRSGRFSDYMREATVLVGERAGWRYL